MSKIKRIYFSKKDINDDEALKARQLYLNEETRSDKFLTDFLKKINDIAYYKYYYPKQFTNDSDDYLFVNDAGKDFYVHVLETLKSWDPNNGSSYSTYLSSTIHFVQSGDFFKDDFLNLNNKNDLEEYEKYNKNNDEDDDENSYKSKYKKRNINYLVSKIEEDEDEGEGICYDIDKEKQDTETFNPEKYLLIKDNFITLIIKCKNTFKGEELKIILFISILEFFEQNHKPFDNLGSYKSLQQTLNEEQIDFVDIDDLIDKKTKSGLPEGKFLAKYLNKSEEQISQTKTRAIKKLQSKKD